MLETVGTLQYNEANWTQSFNMHDLHIATVNKNFKPNLINFQTGHRSSDGNILYLCISNP